MEPIYKRGTKIKIVATVEELINDGIYKRFARKLSGAEGEIVRKVYRTMYEVLHNGDSWFLDRSHFVKIDN